MEEFTSQSQHSGEEWKEDGSSGNLSVIIVGMILMFITVSMTGFLRRTWGALFPGYLIGLSLLTNGFVLQARSDYRGTPSRTFFKILRYIIVGIIILTALAQIYVAISDARWESINLYGLSVDVVLIGYLLAYKPSNRSLGKKSLKVIGYFLTLLSLNACKVFANNGMTMLLVVILAAIGILLIYLGDKKKNSQRTITVEETQSALNSQERFLTDTQDTDDTAIYLIRFLKAFVISAIILAVFIFLILVTFEEYGGRYAAFNIFYLPVYSVTGLWYLYLLWIKRSSKGEDVLLLPIWKKIGLFKDYEDNKQSRKELFLTAPLLIITVICHFMGCILENAFLFAMPIILWIIFILYEYGRQWVNKEQSSKEQLNFTQSRDKQTLQQKVADKNTPKQTAEEKLRLKFSMALQQGIETTLTNIKYSDSFSKDLMLQASLATTYQSLKSDNNANDLRTSCNVLGIDYDAILEEELEKFYAKNFDSYNNQ